MDAKEVKAALKSAREAIKNKEYKDAIKYCKTILKQDKTNYNALVFVAVCAEGLDQPDQALTAYQRAIESSPGQPTAWQGLAAFYEKKPSLNEDEKNGLVSCYEKLMEFFNVNQAKLFDIGQKLCRLHIDLKKQETAIEVYQRLLLQLPELIEEDRHTLWLGMTRVLAEMKNLSDEHRELLMKCFDYIIKSPLTSTEDLERFGQQYIKLLIKVKPTDIKLGDTCSFLSTKCSNMAYPLEVVCVQLVDNYVLGGSELAQTKHIVDGDAKLKDLKPDSGIVSLVEGLRGFIEHDYPTSKTCLSQGVKSSPDVISGWVMLARVKLLMHDYTGAEQACSKGLKLLQGDSAFVTVSSESIDLKLKELKIQAMLSKNNSSAAEQALQLLTETSFNEQFARQAEAKANMVLKEWERSLEVCQNLITDEKSSENLVLLASSYIGMNQYSDAIDCLNSAVSIDGNNARALFLLGKALWDANKGDSRSTCFDHFLKAAKLDPFYFETFLYLGYIYQHSVNNTEKAAKCYRKAFELNLDSDNVGIALVDALVALGRNEEATELLLGVTSRASAGCAKWAWLRLGLQQLRELDYSDSIASLQCALRADSKDYHCWEALGEAYMLRGSYTAALKVFQRATELDDGAIYPLFQIASIKQLLGSNLEAAKEYEAILAKSANYIPALKGLGESYIALAKTALAEFFDGKAVWLCEQAINVLTLAATLRPNLSCTWKLLGDACTIIHGVSQDKVFSVPTKLLESKSGAKNEEQRVISKVELLSVGAKCYGMSLKIQPECSSLWHDLGVNYFRQAQQMKDTDAATELSQKSISALQKALSVEPANHRHWNALGVVYCSSIRDEAALGQHCLIKSIQCEANNVWAWTNLGSLYLSKDSIELAHEAFKVAQSLNPKYVSCWVGQAIIAELVGHEDAMDLFRHTSELANHVESCIGYGHWVVSTLLDDSKRNTELFQYCIHQMSALPAAADCLTRYVERVHDNPIAYNLHGLLLENQKLHESACRSYSRAVELLESDGKKPDLLRTVRYNYARSLRQSGQLHSAIEQYELLEPLDRLEDVASLALAFFKAGMWKEAYVQYQHASKLAESDADVVGVMTALGMTAVKYGDIDSAKTHLFSCVQTGLPTSFPALLTLLALGLLENDFTLSMAALQELVQADKHALSSKQLADLQTLSSMMFIAQGSADEACRSISKAVHQFPWMAQLWGCLAKTCSVMQQFETALHCGLVVHKMVTNISKDDLIVLCLSSIGLCLTSPTEDTLKMASSMCQKAVYMYPGSAEAWRCLLACLKGVPTDGIDETVVNNLKTFVCLLCRDNVPSRLQQWCEQLG